MKTDDSSSGMQVGQGFYFTIHDLFNACPFETAIDAIVFVFEKAKNRGSECKMQKEQTYFCVQ